MPCPPAVADGGSSESSSPLLNIGNLFGGQGGGNANGGADITPVGANINNWADQTRGDLPPPPPPKLPPAPPAEDTFDEETDWLSNLETVVSEAYDLVADCSGAANQSETQYYDTVADLHEILKLTTTELLKINSSAPPGLFKKAANISIALVRRSSKAAPKIRRRGMQLRVKGPNVAQREVALNPSPAPAPVRPTPAEQVAAAAEAEKKRKAEAQYAADLADWRERVNNAADKYRRATSTSHVVTS